MCPYSFLTNAISHSLTQLFHDKEQVRESFTWKTWETYQLSSDTMLENIRCYKTELRYKPEFFINSRSLLMLTEFGSCAIEESYSWLSYLSSFLDTTQNHWTKFSLSVQQSKEKKRKKVSQCIESNCYYHIMSTLIGFSYTLICCLNSSCIKLPKRQKETTVFKLMANYLLTQSENSIQ